MTNTHPFAACFVVTEDAPPDGIRVVRSVLGAISSLPSLALEARLEGGVPLQEGALDILRHQVRWIPHGWIPMFTRRVTRILMGWRRARPNTRARERAREREGETTKRKRERRQIKTAEARSVGGVPLQEGALDILRQQVHLTILKLSWTLSSLFLSCRAGSVVPPRQL